MSDPDTHTREPAAGDDHPPRLYHAVEQATWEQARADGAYPWSTRGVTYAAEGFVHMSRAEQVQGTLDRFFAVVHAPLLLLVVDPALVDAEIRTEAGFEHIYGPLPLSAVVAVLTVARDDGGRWQSPVTGLS